MVEDITGQKFGLLTVIECSHKKHSHTYWKCRCDCGKEITTENNRLHSGRTQSCGCKRSIHATKINSQSRHNPINKGWKSFYWTYVYNSNSKLLGNTLSFEEFKSICSQNCFYCGQPPSLLFTGVYEAAKRGTKKNVFDEKFYEQTKILVNGIDRIDSNVGYQINNVVPCCSICNYAKSNMSQQDFFDWIKRAYKHTFEESIVR